MLREKTYDALMEFGILPTVNGFNYIIDAVEMFDPDMKATELYEEVARENNTTATKVERSMRYAFTRMDYKDAMIQDFFGKKFTTFGYISILHWKLSRGY